MKPVAFPEANSVIAKDQPPYLPLPCWREPAGLPNWSGLTVSCWKLTWRERLRVLFAGRLWISSLTFGRDFQPQRPSTLAPWNDVPG